MLLNKREARIGEILVELFFAGLWTEPQARSIELQNKEQTEQASSIKYLL